MKSKKTLLYKTFEFETLDTYDKNKENILIHYNRGITSPLIINELRGYISFLNEYKNKYNFILIINEMTKEHIYKCLSLIPLFNGFILYTINKEYNTWNEYINFLDNDLNNFPINVKMIFEVGGLLNSNCKFKNSSKINNLLLEKNKEYIKFFSVKKTIYSFYFIISLALKFNISFHHLIIDFEEVDYSKIDYCKKLKYKRYFQYKSEIFNIKYKLDLLNYYYKNEFLFNNNKLLNKFFNNKKYDLVSGYTVLTPNRKFIYKYDYIFNINNLITKFFIKDKYRKKDNYVSKEEYLKYIFKSKFTLIFPPYEKKMFSYNRFIESIAQKCIPLIIDDCFIDEAFSNFEKENFINYLLVNETNIEEKIKNLDYNKIINDLYNYYIINRCKNLSIEDL